MTTATAPHPESVTAQPNERSSNSTSPLPTYRRPTYCFVVIPSCTEPTNLGIVTGDWRPIDLTKPPFDLPQPVELLNEGCTEQGGAFADKSLGLWPVSSLRGTARTWVERR